MDDRGGVAVPWPDDVPVTDEAMDWMRDAAESKAASMGGRLAGYDGHTEAEDGLVWHLWWMERV